LVAQVKGLTIACNHEELIIFVNVVNLDIRERSNYLLLGGKVGALLELKVTDCTRQGKVAVHATKVDKATCGLDTRLLGCRLLARYSDADGERAFVLGLVVK
jgi:hypothetical protein